MNIRTKLIGTIVVGAALLAPVAQAAQSPDDQAGPRGPGAIAAQQQNAAAVRPDDRGGIRGPGAVSADLSVATHPDNRAEPRGAGAFTEPVVVSTSSNSFEWRDALIGGLGGMGTALLLAGCLFLLTSQRSKTRLA